jgi:hypothetical protein
VSRKIILSTVYLCLQAESTGLRGRPRKELCVADMRKIGQALLRAKAVAKAPGKENLNLKEEVGRITRSQKRQKMGAHVQL